MITSIFRKTWRPIAAGAVLAVVAVGLTATPANADPLPPQTLPTPVSAKALPTWQINGVAWSQAIVGNTVYVSGSFTKARPPGVPVGGAGEVDALNVFAYDLTTGNRVASFNHSLNAQGLVVRAAPDGSRVYVGGDFTAVDGQARGHVAAFSTADHSLLPWDPNIQGQVRGLGITGDTVYVGGNFGSANGQVRGSLAAFNVANRNLKPWAPTATGPGGYVWTMTMSPDSSRVIVGGSFDTLSGVAAYGMGALLATTGDVMPWAANQRIRAAGLYGAITSLKADGEQVYGSGYAFGSGATFEGTFAADPNTGAINWVNDCLGDTYDTFTMGQVVYAVSHAHNCSAINGFPDTSPRARWQKATASPSFATGTITVKDAYGWDYRGLPYAGSVHWYPDLKFGSVTSAGQAAWSVTGSGDYVTLAGEFPLVNGVAQQGLVRFATRGVQGSQKPEFSAAMTPTATSTESGSVRVTWQSTWDRDDAALTYDVYRDNGGSIATLTQESVFWNLPAMGFIDSGRTPGASHIYKIRAKDSDGNVQWSSASAPVTVSAAALAAYPQLIKADGASHLWRFDDAGPAFVDSAGFADGTSTAVTFGSAGALAGSAATSAGGSSPKLYVNGAEAHPSAVSLEAWVKTTSTSGGRIIGFGDSKSGTSTTTGNDMVLYLANSGRVNFSLNNGAWRNLQSGTSVNDGQWHHLVATADSSGQSLFIDGRRVGRDQTPMTMATFAGYWRVLADQTSGLPNKPTNAALPGSLDEVAVYGFGLTQDQVKAHYLASGRPATWTTTAPSDAYGSAVVAGNPDFYWRLGEANGTTAADASGSGQSATIPAGATLGVAGALSGVANTAVTLNGTNAQIVNKEASNAPTTFTAETWFKSTTTKGGKLIGFGNAASGLSSAYDRQVCLLNTGKLAFGTTSNGTQNIAQTPGAFNDGQWHHVVASQGPDGMKLYVDSVLQATHSASDAQTYAGYWRVGGDRCWSGTTSTYLAGSLDEAAVYPRVLTQSEVDQHYAASGRILPNKLPTAAFTHTEHFTTVSVDGATSSDLDGSIASYAWAFGDGGTGAGPLASHTYAAAGTYPVTLTVTDNRAGVATTTQSVSVVANVAPTAAFTPALSYLTVSANAAASTDPDGTIATYSWAFGDGGTGSGATASHTYAAAGTYPVTLSVTDDFGATSTVAQDVTVVANGAPTATFTHGETFLQVSVDASASSDPEGALAAYSWNFGDGSTGSGAVATHAYAADGTYQVTLTVTDDGGATATHTESVTVQAPVNQVPTAVFSHSETFLVASVDAAGSSDPEGPLASYNWTWGDGATSTGVAATHAYAAAGSYQVTLTVTDGAGAEASSTVTLTVTANPVFATDAFERTVSGGWGTADLGGAWTVSGTTSRYTVVGGQGRVSIAAGTGALSSLTSMSSTSTEVSAVVTSDKAPTGGGQFVSVIGRQVSPNNDYRAKIRMAAGGVTSVWLAKTENGAETLLSSANLAGVSYVAGDRLAVRLQVSGTSPTTMRVKVWKVGTSEPVDWTLTGTDGSPNLQSAGSIGLYSYLSGSTTNGPVIVGVDDVWAGQLRP
ncbi:MAG: PKD domain-containing protein [Candidatus Phosphoribacter sp.]